MVFSELEYFHSCGIEGVIGELVCWPSAQFHLAGYWREVIHLSVVCLGFNFGSAKL